MIADLDTASMEAGYALALDKKLIAIGPSHSLMFSLFSELIRPANNWSEAIQSLLSARNLEIIGGKYSGHFKG